MDDLFALAEMMGVGIEWEDFLPMGWVGAFCAIHRIVYMLRGRPRAVMRTALAHELGHAHHGHGGRRTTEDEWKADVFAVKVLLDPGKYLEAARDNPPIEELARRLDVTPHLIRVAIRSARGPSNFTRSQTIKLREGLSTPGGARTRPVEPRRLTAAIPLVRVAA